MYTLGYEESFLSGIDLVIVATDNYDV
jgi:hypothetical protein